MKTINYLDFLSKEIYTPSGLVVNNVFLSSESTEYQACSYQLNNMSVIGRKAKITPKKIGQFVTLWKRTAEGKTTPFDLEDNIELFIINVLSDERQGLFVFPKAVLLEQGIIAGGNNEGKRGFRVYPPWDQPVNKTAQKTQNWQLHYFLRIRSDFKTDSHRVCKLFANVKTTSTD